MAIVGIPLLFKREDTEQFETLQLPDDGIVGPQDGMRRRVMSASEAEEETDSVLAGSVTI